MTPIDRVLERLERVRPSGKGWSARCPAHDDRHPSLSISEDGHGNVGLYCHRGCLTESVVAAIDLEMSDLFAESASTVRTRGDTRPRIAVGEPELERLVLRLRGDVAVLARLADLRGWTPEALEALEVGFDGHRLVFPARDAAGHLVGLDRYEPDPERRRDRPKMVADRGSRRELFPRPEILSQGAKVPGSQTPIDVGTWHLIVEGQPDVASAWSVGLPAVGIPGVNGWRRDWAARFRGRRVCVCLDSDEPGRQAAQRVASDLAAAADEVRVLDVSPSKDIGEILGLAKSGAEREQAREFILGLVEDAPTLESETKDVPETKDIPASQPSTLLRLDVTSMIASDPPPVEYLVEPVLIPGTLTLIVGKEGVGKSLLGLGIGVSACTGEHLAGFEVKQ